MPHARCFILVFAFHLLLALPGAAQSDLTVSFLSFSETLAPGDTLGEQARVVARNTGNEFAAGTLDSPEGYMVDIVLSTDRQVPSRFAIFSATFREDVLLRGGRKSNTRDLPPDTTETFDASGSEIPTDTPDGDYFLCARVDPGNKVEELDEGNNLTCEAVRVVSSARPEGVVGAFVEVQGGDVFVNGEAISGSRTLFENDKVSTGGNGWARIHFDVGGTLSMDPNSDPKLQFISQAGCVAGELVVTLWKGTFTAQGVSNVCFNNPTHQATVDPASDFRIEITDQSFGLSVTSGQVLVSTGPARLRRFTVPVDFGITVRTGETTGPQRIIK